MRWLVFAILFTASLGCQQQPMTLDPFAAYGPTQIPPPPTGTAGRTDPYYRRSLSSNNNTGGALTVFTSDDSRLSAELADRRGTLNQSSSNESGVRWRSPAASETLNVSPQTARPRPRLSGDRRLGSVMVGARNEPEILGPVEAARGLSVSGADRLLRPQSHVAPAAHQHLESVGSGWTNRY